MGACWATIHLTSSFAGTCHPAPLQVGGDRSHPGLADDLPFGDQGKASPQRRSMRTTGPVTGLDGPRGFCHPGTW